MSKHSFSVLTSDIRRNPSILPGLQQKAASQIDYIGRVTTAEHGAVTTVTAVAA
ncbi:hypothetical protein ACIPY0_20440 [Paenarthrobacter nicotinovorans]|uniref:hypothetical protein n=1 Tax=Paenarthrobacter nicotinovorans TaxID=29320 RepID=UPI0038183983